MASYTLQDWANKDKEYLAWQAYTAQPENRSLWLAWLRVVGLLPDCRAVAAMRAAQYMATMQEKEV